LRDLHYEAKIITETQFDIMAFTRYKRQSNNNGTEKTKLNVNSWSNNKRDDKIVHSTYKLDVHQLKCQYLSFAMCT